MLLSIAGLLVLAWLVLLLVHVTAWTIHLILVVAVLVFLYDLLVDRDRR